MIDERPAGPPCEGGPAGRTAEPGGGGWSPSQIAAVTVVCLAGLMVSLTMSVLIPVLPSQFDVWAAEETVKLLEECAVYKKHLKAAFVINRKIANTAIGRDVKGKLAPIFYLAGIALAFVSTTVSQLLYAAVALMWLVPDRRIEAAIARED